MMKLKIKIKVIKKKKFLNENLNQTTSKADFLVFKCAHIRVNLILAKME